MAKKKNDDYIEMLEISAEEAGYRLVAVDADDGDDTFISNNDSDPYTKSIARLESKIADAEKRKERNRQTRGEYLAQDFDKLEILNAKRDELKRRQENERLAEERFVAKCLENSEFGTRSDFKRLFRQRRVDIALSEAESKLGRAKTSSIYSNW